MDQNEKQAEQQSNSDWLIKLATESYQAELIVSGIAILGVSLLPGYISELINWVLQSLDSAYFTYYYFIFTYISFGIGIVYISLIFHFIARTLWIGLVGLHSVFPNGINFDQMEHLSEDYREKLKRDLPDFQTFIEQLDRFCSMIFAFAFGIASVMISIAIVITAILGLTGLLKLIIPSLPVPTVANILITLLFTPIFISSILSLKSLREKNWVKRIHYPMTKRITQIVYNINFLPLTFILSIFSSNYKLKKVGIVYMVTIFVVGSFVLIFVVQNSNLMELSGFQTEIRGSRSDRIEVFEYADQLGPEEVILSPIIPSDQISSDYLKLFVPLPQRTENVLDEICGEWEASSESIDKLAKRAERRQFKLNCIGRSLTIQLDNQAIPDVSWAFYDHPHDGTQGTITYLPTNSWAEGKHILTVMEPQPVGEEKGKKQQNIVFWLIKD